MEGPGNVAALLEELASQHRVRFLRALREGPSTASQLAKLSNLSVQEGMRHLARLLQWDLVERRGGREYVLTPVGHLVVDELPYFEAIAADRGFFLGHDLDFLPHHLSRTTLARAERARGLEADHLLEMEGMMANSGRFLFRAASQTFWNLWPSTVSVKGPVAEWWGLYTPDAVRTERFLGLGANLARSVPGIHATRIRIALLPDLPFMLAVNERQALMFVRHRGGGLDFGTLLRSRDEPFRNWGEALFRHYAANAYVVFDTTRGDTLAEWEQRIREGLGKLTPA